VLKKMQTLFSGKIYLHYHWFYLGEPDGEVFELGVSFKDQKNGICGSRTLNYADFLLGLHTGSVDLDFIWYDSRPEILGSWQEVIESPLIINKTCELFLTDFNGDPYGKSISLNPGSYRIRVSAINFGLLEATGDQESKKTFDGSREEERYEVALWKADFQLDEVIRCTSQLVAALHKEIEASNDNSQGLFRSSRVERLTRCVLPHLEELPPNIASHIQENVCVGDELFERGAYQLAVEKYSLAWQLIPNPKESWQASTWIATALGDSYFQSQSFAPGAEILRKAISCPGGLGVAFIHLRLGQCEFELGNQEEAVNQLMRAYALDGATLFFYENPKYTGFLRDRVRPPITGVW
jgi:tetratricopeptide (TPR) repeat protein